MKEEDTLRERLAKLETEVVQLKKLVAKLEERLRACEPTGPKLIGKLSDRVSRSLNQQPDEQLPRRRGPQID